MVVMENHQLAEDMNFILSAKDQKGVFLAGTDEVGRGPLAGPVVASTVMAIQNRNKEPFFWGNLFSFLKEKKVTDSKKLTEKKRSLILKEVLGVTNLELMGTQETFKKEIDGGALLYSVAKVSPLEIDQLNILKASQLAMIRSFESCLKEIGDHFEGTLLIDGHLALKLKNPHVKEIPLVKGDGRSLMIGLASIIAKSYRDDLMVKQGLNYQGYDLEKHKGYPTKKHLDAIKKLGPSPIHRYTFKGVKEYVNQEEKRDQGKI